VGRHPSPGTGRRPTASTTGSSCSSATRPTLASRDRSARLGNQADRQEPLTVSDHGGSFVTPNCEYVVEGGQYATVLGYGYAPIEEYKKSYRGMVTLWKFDRRRVGSMSPTPSRSSSRPTGRIGRFRQRRPATGSSSSTRSTPRWQPAASRRATRHSRPAPASATWIPAHH